MRQRQEIQEVLSRCVSVRPLLREDGDPQAQSIDEVWNLTKPVDGQTGWLLAGIQQMH